MATVTTSLTLSLAVLFSVLAAHPFVTYPLSLMLLRRLRPVPIRTGALPGPGPTFSICVCAHDEAGVIRDTVANLVALRGRIPDLEILIYDDASADGTAEILRRYGDRVTVVTSPRRTGKTAGMNRLAAMSRGGVLVFSDADVVVAPDALVNLGRYFADPEVGCVCGHLRCRTGGGRSTTAANASDYRRLGEFIKQLESDTGSVVGADGALFAVRRELHEPVPEGLIDDMYLSLRILADGHRVIRAPDVTVFENPAAAAGDEFRRKVRIACQAFNVHARLWPRLRQLDALHGYKYASHKLLRWLMVYNVALAAAFSLLTFARLAGWRPALGAAALGAATLAVGHALKLPPLSRLGDALIAVTGTGVGVLYAIRGKEFRTWTPVASARGAE